MEILIDNSKYRLTLEPHSSYNYIVWFKANGFMQEITRALNFCNKITKFFDEKEIRHAKSKIHAINYVNHKFK